MLPYEWTSGWYWPLRPISEPESSLMLWITSVAVLYRLQTYSSSPWVFVFKQCDLFYIYMSNFDIQIWKFRVRLKIWHTKIRNVGSQDENVTKIVWKTSKFEYKFVLEVSEMQIFRACGARAWKRINLAKSPRSAKKLDIQEIVKKSHCFTYPPPVRPRSETFIKETLVNLTYPPC